MIGVLAAFGTRPEAIKMCPLIKELEKRGCFDITVLAGGQHVESVRSVAGEFGVKIEMK